MKTMCPPGYHPKMALVATHALGHMIYGYKLLGSNEPKSAQQAKQGCYHHNATKPIVVITGRAHCFP